MTPCIGLAELNPAVPRTTGGESVERITEEVGSCSIEVCNLETHSSGHSEETSETTNIDVGRGT